MVRGAGDASTVAGECWAEGDGCCKGADAVSRDTLLPPVVRLGAGAPPAPTMDEAVMLATCSNSTVDSVRGALASVCPSASCLDKWFLARCDVAGREVLAAVEPKACGARLHGSRRSTTRRGDAFRRTVLSRSVWAAVCCVELLCTRGLAVALARGSAGTRLLTLLYPPVGRPMNSALMVRPVSHPRPVHAVHF
jgi:hypothetical protein